MTSTNSLTVFIVDDDDRNAYSDACLSKAVGVIPSRLGDLPRAPRSRGQPRVVEHDRHRREVRGRILLASGCGVTWRARIRCMLQMCFPSLNEGRFRRIFFSLRPVHSEPALT